MPSRIKVSFQRNEPIPTNMPADYDWLKANRSALAEQYGSCLIVIYNQQVLGIGTSYQEALANAEANLPDAPEIITPIVQPIGFGSFRLRRVRHDENREDA